jgi:hypothetical protein
MSSIKPHKTLAPKAVHPSTSEHAFHGEHYASITDAFRYGLNEQFWRWGLVFNQGNGWNVSEDRIKQRLRFIASRLLRKIYGNRHRDKAKVRFLIFKHGSTKSFDQHYHALMGFEGQKPAWSDFHIQMKVRDIDAEFIKSNKSEKLVSIDWDWTSGNRYHSYVSRFVQLKVGSSDDWFFI